MTAPPGVLAAVLSLALRLPCASFPPYADSMPLSRSNGVYGALMASHCRLMPCLWRLIACLCRCYRDALSTPCLAIAMALCRSLPALPLPMALCRLYGGYGACVAAYGVSRRLYAAPIASHGGYAAYALYAAICGPMALYRLPAANGASIRFYPGYASAFFL